MKNMCEHFLTPFCAAHMATLHDVLTCMRYVMRFALLVLPTMTLCVANDIVKCWENFQHFKLINTERTNRHPTLLV